MVELDQIIKGCRQYNKFAQKILYDMYAPKMKGLCCRYIGDSETAKDIVQDGFMKVFSNIKQYKKKGSFEGWMKRIFINTAISYIRKFEKENKHLRFENINESGLIETDDDEPVDYSKKKNKSNDEIIDPNLLADLSETELLEALQKVPEKFRTVFNLFCIEHLKHDEIAKVLKIDKTTSRTRLARARSMIQKELHTMCLAKQKKQFYE